MSLDCLQVECFRNIQHAIIKPVSGLNIISGENAAGKTSLLEAIFYLSYGRSFRSSQSRDLIHYESTHFRLLAEFESEDNYFQIGLERNIQQQNIRLNKQTIKSISELSALLPIICLHPDSHQLISGGPENRRQYMDWGVFHVEHQFIQYWRKYRKSLSQRNAALRTQQSTELCQLWNTPLIESALNIEKTRATYLESLFLHIKALAAAVFPSHEITLDYRKGWPDDISYEEYLYKAINKDKEKGFTQYGPHRADLKIKLDGKSAQHSISRGQQKKLVALLKLAQLRYFNQTSKQQALVLFDDLPAELDDDNRCLIMKLLADLNVQLFVTSVQPDLINRTAWDKIALFHVEHGVVTQLPSD